MKTISLFFLFFSSSVCFSQYLIDVQDTSALPTTQLQDGRQVRINGVRYLYQYGAWFTRYGKMWNKDSIGGGATPPDSTVWAKLWKLGLYQLIIPNLADTSKSVKKSDTLTYAGTKSDLNLKLNISAVKQGAYLSDTTLGLVYDTLAFTTTATRTAKKITGIKPTSWFVASPRKQADALPVAGDLLSVRCKTDSIIIFRAAGTTSGLQVTIIGKK